MRIFLRSEVLICALGYGNPTKVACSNQQKRAYITCSIGMFLLIAACRSSQVSVAQGTYEDDDDEVRNVR